MSLFEICQWLQNTQFGTSLRESIWMFPIVESTHVLGLSISVGTLLWMDLRLTGKFMKHQPISKISNSVLPWTLIGYTIMTITGILLFWCQAVKAYNSNGLWLKDPDAVAAEAIELRDEGGFSGLKLRLGRDSIHDDMATIEAVRKSVGNDVALMVDFNQA